MNLVNEVGDYYIQNKAFVDAITLYFHVQKIYPYMEESYFKLMQLYNKLGDRYLTEQQYHKLKDMLISEYEEEPSTPIKSRYDNWIRKNVKTFNVVRII